MRVFVQLLLKKETKIAPHLVKNKTHPEGPLSPCYGSNVQQKVCEIKKKKKSPNLQIIH